MSQLELAPLETVDDKDVRKRPRGYWAHRQHWYARLGSGRWQHADYAWDKEQVRMGLKRMLDDAFRA